MADPWGREGSDRAKLPVELGPHLQAGAWQSQGTGTQGPGSSLLAPSLSQDQRSELGIVKAHWVGCLFVRLFLLIFGSFPPGFKANCLWNIPAYLRGARG